VTVTFAYCVPNGLKIPMATKVPMATKS
jgi:hypothetical protein